MPEVPAHLQTPAEPGARRPLGLYAVGIAAVAAAVVAAGHLQLSRSSYVSVARQARADIAERGPRVEVIAATPGPDKRTITLLADARSNAVATMYSKVSGYVKEIPVDRGDRVEAGQIVAQIEAPELEHQYNAAVTDLEHKRRNFARSRELLVKGNTTEVATLQYETDARVAEANVTALATTKDYQTIRAPFAGRVTARFVDPGALVTNAQTNFVSSQPMMTISDDSRLRVFAYLQQQDVPFVKTGATAVVIDASNRDRRREAKVTRMNGELDPRARAMQIEVNIDNRDGFLASGSFAYIAIDIPIASYPQIPVSGLIVRGEDNFVAVVDNDVVRFRPIRVAATDGNTIAVATGLQPGERIAVNLPDEVTDGSRIQAIARR
jgi:RND family efflux transporter MFP subunit